MIPNTKHRELESKGVTASGAFGISLKDSAHIMTILRDTLYSDKVMAVLREYSSNAWDAHRSVGKHDVPIKVVMPTRMEPTLTIQDFGPGLSPEDVFQVYTQYGASTKRDSDDAVGMLGIGSKSGFAYSDSFTIISCHGGKRRTYVAVLDESEAGVINLLHEEDCGDATGVSIQIAIRPNDLWEFTNKARELYKHFDPRPEINIDLPPPPAAHNVMGHGALYENEDSGWLAKMGCVAYKVDLDQLKGQSKKDSIGEYAYRLSGCLNFNIGDLAINASREGLKYTDATKKALITKVEMLVDEFVRHTIDTLEKGEFRPWDKRIRSQILTRLGLPIPKSLQDIVKTSASIKNPPKTFTLWRNKHAAHDITITDRTRILLQNERKRLAGYGLTAFDHLVRPLPGQTWAAVLVELGKLVKDLDIEGVPTMELSAITWNPALVKRQGKQFNEKHHFKTFILSQDKGYYHPYSRAWSIISRKPEAEDVFVILESFKVPGYDFYYEYKQDKRLFELFGKTMPTVYGYKSTEKKPLDAKNIPGTEYKTWREKAIKDLVTPKVSEIMELKAWNDLFHDHHYYWRPNRQSAIRHLVGRLGKYHPISLLFRKYSVAASKIQKIQKTKIYEAYNLLSRRLANASSPTLEYEGSAGEERDKLLERYPLLKDRIYDLWGSEEEAWTNYVRVLDFYYANQKEDAQ